MHPVGLTTVQRTPCVRCIGWSVGKLPVYSSQVAFGQALAHREWRDQPCQQECSRQPYHPPLSLCNNIPYMPRGSGAGRRQVSRRRVERFRTPRVIQTVGLLAQKHRRASTRRPPAPSLAGLMVKVSAECARSRSFLRRKCAFNICQRLVHFVGIRSRNLAAGRLKMTREGLDAAYFEKQLCCLLF